MGIRYVGRLRSFLRTPRTIQRYQRAVGQFAVWARTKGIRVRTAAEADAALQLYFDQLFDEGSGRGRSVAAAVLSGVQVAQPAWRGQLHGAQESLAGWAKKVPTESYPPLVHHLAVACAVWLAHQGRWRAGAAVLVAFEGLLRVTEMASMNVGDVLLPEDSRVGDGDVKGATLCLPRTKTGAQPVGGHHQQQRGAMPEVAHAGAQQGPASCRVERAAAAAGGEGRVCWTGSWGRLRVALVAAWQGDFAAATGRAGGGDSAAGALAGLQIRAHLHADTEGAAAAAADSKGSGCSGAQDGS
jgi:hypothetical protein